MSWAKKALAARRHIAGLQNGSLEVEANEQVHETTGYDPATDIDPPQPVHFIRRLGAPSICRQVGPYHGQQTIALGRVTCVECLDALAERRMPVRKTKAVEVDSATDVTTARRVSR